MRDTSSSTKTNETKMHGVRQLKMRGMNGMKDRIPTHAHAYTRIPKGNRDKRSGLINTDFGMSTEMEMHLSLLTVPVPVPIPVSLFHCPTTLNFYFASHLALQKQNHINLQLFFVSLPFFYASLPLCLFLLRSRC